VAVVPVGLTRFREHLAPLRPVTEHDARRYVESWAARQRAFQEKLGTRWAYLADEFYLLANAEVPSADAYEGFPQIENGVGLARSFLDAFEQGRPTLPRKLPVPRAIVLVTGVLGGRLLRQIAERLGRIGNLRAEIAVVQNAFFGESVTVSGLLTGRDVICALSRNEALRQPDAVVILPPNCMNSEGKLLDDVSLSDLRDELSCEVVLGSYDLTETLRGVLGADRQRSPDASPRSPCKG
jgi:NifB/MoaA-like Fe-S oxidoreductase